MWAVYLLVRTMVYQLVTEEFSCLVEVYNLSGGWTELHRGVIIDWRGLRVGEEARVVFSPDCLTVAIPSRHANFPTSSLFMRLSAAKLTFSWAMKIYFLTEKQSNTDTWSTNGTNVCLLWQVDYTSFKNTKTWSFRCWWYHLLIFALMLIFPRLGNGKSAME